jgi:hypothetical protein
MSTEALNEALASEPATRNEGRRAPRRANEDVRRERLNPLASEVNGVKVEFDGIGTYAVGFSYHPALVAEMRKIEGAEFDRNADVWKVPASQYEALAEATKNMRGEFLLDAAARGDIEQRAAAVGKERQQANGTSAEVAPRVSEFHGIGDPIRGEIVSVNDRYAAQLTGFGKTDGVSFITLHSLAGLSEPVFKGDQVSIEYGEKGRAKVTQNQTVEEKLDKSLGRAVDGVTVVRDGDKYKISFDFNPAMSDRINRVAGTTFDKEQKVHVADGNLKNFVARAVNDMRKEYVADRGDREKLEAIANERIDGAKVHNAFTRDGQNYAGRVLAVSDRYVLQHTGKDHVALHRKDSLKGDLPDVGDNARISYKGGRGEIKGPQQDRSQSQEHSR